MKNESGKIKSGKKQEPPVDAVTIYPEVRKDRTQSILVLTITCLGVTILFSSWIFQNYFKSRWLDEKSYLEKSQFLIEIETANAEQWKTIFNSEANATSPNKIRHLLSAYNYVKSITKLLAWEEARGADNDYKETPIIVKNLMHAKAKQLFEKQDILGLTNMVILAGEVQNKFIKSLDETYFSKLAEANLRSSFWDKMFLAFYIFGSLLIGARWFLVNVLSWPSRYLKKHICTTNASTRTQ
ncbi:MAG: hypothetical protein Q7K21_01275 [Elusimicrobiota bacterium]|nr:hypothetical protein [Elusimicrobiota bacterium]